MPRKTRSQRHKESYGICDGFSTMPTPFTEEEVQWQIDCVEDTHLPVHWQRISRYAELRALGDENHWSPRHPEYQKACEASETIRTIFMADRVQSRNWTGQWYWDFFYYILQQHPVLGFFEKGPHPMTYEDRALVIIGGLCAAMLNSATRICSDALCVLPGDPDLRCYSERLNNGICEDGGNFTHLGTKADPDWPCDFGHDCGDCGPRNEFEYQWITFQYWGSDEGIRCFSVAESWLWNIGWGIFVAVIMVVVKQLIMCKCYLWGKDEAARLAIDLGQTAGVCIVSVLCMMAGSVAGYYGMDWLNLLETKLLAYTFALGGMVVAFILSSAKERARIHKYGSIENYIKATTMLYPEEDIVIPDHVDKKDSADA